MEFIFKGEQTIDEFHNEAASVISSAALAHWLFLDYSCALKGTTLKSCRALRKPRRDAAMPSMLVQSGRG
jgi:hypothetical protein